MVNKGTTGTSYARGVFPLAANDGSRSIVRQNSITNAVALYGKLTTEETSAEEAAYAVINIARIFEKYSAGDIDAELNKQIEETFTVT